MKLTHDNFTLGEYVKYGLDSDDRLTRRLAELLSMFTDEYPDALTTEDVLDKINTDADRIMSLEAQLTDTEYELEQRTNEVIDYKNKADSLNYELDEDNATKLNRELKAQIFRVQKQYHSALREVKAADRKYEKDMQEFQKKYDILETAHAYLKEKHNTFTILAN